jgi:hypothetical protein
MVPHSLPLHVSDDGPDRHEIALLEDLKTPHGRSTAGYRRTQGLDNDHDDDHDDVR